MSTIAPSIESTSQVTSWLAERLPQLVEQHGVPGATVAVSCGAGDVLAAAAGSINLGTGVPATVDTLFQVGSVTKVLTATLVLDLAEQGRLDIDAPIRRYLPGFAVADEEASAQITARDLLTHTSGVFGDAFVDVDRERGALESYLADVVPTLELDVPRGSGLLSYSNSAFSILGRLAEVVAGKPYLELMAERIMEPLAVTEWAGTPDAALLHRAAVGHLPLGADGAPVPTTRWRLPSTIGPAGGQLAMSARALVAFARGVMTHRLLTAATLDEMLAPQVAVPRSGTLPAHWGLGWMLFDWPVAGAEDARVVGHDGGTIGQASSLRMVPDAGVVVATIANGGGALAFNLAVQTELLALTAGVTVPAPVALPPLPEPVDADFAHGTFVNRMTSTRIYAEDGQTWVAVTPLTPEAEALVDPRPFPVVRLDDTHLIAVRPVQGLHEVLLLVGDPTDGPARYLGRTGRLTARAAS